MELADYVKALKRSAEILCKAVGAYQIGVLEISDVEQASENFLNWKKILNAKIKENASTEKK